MRWTWIDRIIELEKGVRSAAIKNVSLAEEHLHDHFPGTPVMPGTLIIEGMAQTAGILVGHARDFKEKVILAKIGKATFDADVRPGHTLIYRATLDRIDDSGASTAGTVELVDNGISAPGNTPRVIGTIEMMFSHIDQNMRGMGFPEHNFVFSSQFMDLLRNSGFGA